MNRVSRENEQRDWYTDNYAKLGEDRNDPRVNRGVLFQTLASERSLIRAFRRVAIPPSSLRVLDIGCGSGANWYQLIRLGVKPVNITGIEIQSERLAGLKELYPQASGVCGDATCTGFPDDSFQLVCETGLFATLNDEALRSAIAAEMLRVCRPNGYLLLIDWRIRKFWDPSYGALTRGDLRRLFGAGSRARVICTAHGALIPPVGRWLSKFAWPLYFLVAWLFPPLVGQVAYLLQKQSNTEAN